MDTLFVKKENETKSLSAGNVYLNKYVCVCVCVRASVCVCAYMFYFASLYCTIFSVNSRWRRVKQLDRVNNLLR